MTIQPEILEAHGFRLQLWNAGKLIEYWKPLCLKDGWNWRLAVRFGEFRDRPSVVWLITGRAMTQLPHIDTVEKLEQLYELLNWIEPKNLRGE